jgi:hypothetical protein
MGTPRLPLVDRRGKLSQATRGGVEETLPNNNNDKVQSGKSREKDSVIGYGGKGE